MLFNFRLFVVVSNWNHFCLTVKIVICRFYISPFNFIVIIMTYVLLLVPRFLNVIKRELSYPLTILYRSIMAGQKVANVVPVYKRGSRNVATN